MRAAKLLEVEWKTLPVGDLTAQSRYYTHGSLETANVQQHHTPSCI